MRQFHNISAHHLLLLLLLLLQLGLNDEIFVCLL